MTEDATKSTDNYELERARELLIEAGYKVSETPMSWNSCQVVVELKILGLMTEKDLVKIIDYIIQDALPSLEKLRSFTHILNLHRTDVRRYSGPYVKAYTKVAASEKWGKS